MKWSFYFLSKEKSLIIPNNNRNKNPNLFLNLEIKLRILIYKSILNEGFYLNKRIL